tara:strand:- start:78 stop:371 length:294 start_codon:yes stop_codon:yes gene_type:complete
MKRVLIILFFFPIFGFTQELRYFNHYDIFINQVLENTANFIKDKNTPEINFRFYLVTKDPLVNWNQKRFSKWQILEDNSKQLKKIETNLKIDNYEKN